MNNTFDTAYIDDEIGKTFFDDGDEIEVQEKTEEITKDETNEEKQNDIKELSPEDMTAQMNKSMSWFMPVMSVSIAIIAPLGLALYWLVNNILMIAERLILNIVIKSEEEQND